MTEKIYYEADWWSLIVAVGLTFVLTRETKGDITVYGFIIFVLLIGSALCFLGSMKKFKIIGQKLKEKFITEKSEWVKAD